MKCYLKYLFVLPFIFISFKIFAFRPVVLIRNASNFDLELVSRYQNRNDIILKQTQILKSYQFYIGSTSKYVFNRRYFIEIVDTNEKCSTLKTLGLSHANGWGLKIFIKGIEVGKICSTKYSVIDYQAHAELIYVINKFGKEELIFRNIGWWAQNSAYPIQLIINLGIYEDNYSEEEIYEFINSTDPKEDIKIKTYSKPLMG